MSQSKTATWKLNAGKAQHSLETRFWNPNINMYNIKTPCPDGSCNTIFHYWWMAHAVETLVDGWRRSGETFYKERLSCLYQGLLSRNGGQWPNNLYDDMEWMAIGWLRAFLATGNEEYKQAAITLWEDIKTGWNEHMGGGIAWQKTQLDYKNTPANAPAAILAARLYAAFGNEADLEWSLKIYNWLKQNLVDPLTGFVWDGMNRLGDGKIDKDWKFSYCQGVFIGAAVELYRITGDHDYLDDALKTWRAAVKELTEPAKNLFLNEGRGDAGLFKGILVRYAGELAGELSEVHEVTEVLASNATALWDCVSDSEHVLIGGNWGEAPSGDVELCTQISGIILLETMSKLERDGLLVK